MKTKVLFVKDIEDFNELRNLDGDVRATVILLDDLDFKGKKFEPIEFNGEVDLILRGFGMNISNMDIICDKDNCGIFSNVNNLNIKDVNFFNIHTVGKNNTGSIVGKVNNKLTLIHSKIISKVNGEDMVGGICGTAKRVKIIDSLIATKVNALSNSGLALGACESFKDHNNTFVKLNQNKTHEETNENKTGIVLFLK